MAETQPIDMPVQGNPNDSSSYPQYTIIDSFFPGFSLFQSALLQNTGIDLNLYIRGMMILGLAMWAWQYLSDWCRTTIDEYFMSSADIRIDDEMYNMLMSWVAKQSFAKGSRRFVANTNLNSRMWYMWKFDEEEEGGDDGEEIDFDEDGNPISKNDSVQNKGKKVLFTPSFGTHYFWYKKRLLQFRRKQNMSSMTGPSSEKEEISITAFGRNPKILKELLDECRTAFLANDENRTIIYRGGHKAAMGEPGWTRCVSRITRPFSTVVLDEQVKQNLLADMKDYLHPYTRRWYSNRGIPYRRGYLLHGPPGTGKSSLSFAIAGYFKLKIYIVSLNSGSMNEETLSAMFTELPKQCVVLLEDIDTAGLTHTRDDDEDDDDEEEDEDVDEANPMTAVKRTLQKVANNSKKSNGPPSGKVSLSALLNVLDGVASQEGRILIMTTNHIEKLDEALIRPGRVDMMVHFDLASKENMQQIFKGIYATLEGDFPAHMDDKSECRSITSGRSRGRSTSVSSVVSKKATRKQNARSISKERRMQKELDRIIAAEDEMKRVEEEERIEKLAKEFSERVPAGKFSPAEIQGYLLKHKRSAANAVEGAEAWVLEREQEKEKAKLKDSQEREKKEKEEKEEKEKEAKALEELEKLEAKEMEELDAKAMEELAAKGIEKTEDTKAATNNETTDVVNKLKAAIISEVESQSTEKSTVDKLKKAIISELEDHLLKRSDTTSTKYKDIELAKRGKKTEKGSVEMIEYAGSDSDDLDSDRVEEISV